MGASKARCARRTFSSVKFAIAAPPYRNSSAGVRVLHRLCHLLNELGEDAALTTAMRHPTWNTRSTANIDDDTIVVYPEDVAGNPLGARRVVRYFVLSRVGALRGGSTPAEGNGRPAELVVYLDDWMRDAASTAAGTALPASHRLFLSVLEPDIFFPGRGPRFIDCVYVGKAHDRAARFPRYAPFWRFRISERHPASREGLAILLRRTRALYAYDHTSALPFEAAICGARVQLVTDDGSLAPSIPWETHALVREWWDDGPRAVRQFVRLVRAHWNE